MKSKLLTTTLAALGLVFAMPAFAQHAHGSDAKKPAAPAKKSADNYPLKTCVVSDEALGSMGDFISYVHREPGKPDREVRFCCEGCVDDFKKEPAKYLKKIDAAKSKSGEKKANKANS